MAGERIRKNATVEIGIIKIQRIVGMVQIVRTINYERTINCYIIFHSIGCTSKLSE